MLKLPKNNSSYWREIIHTPTYSELQGDLAVDAVIIGGGITGLTSAYLLKESGLKVAVVEKSTVGSGTTGRTTGKVTSQHNLIYAEFAKRLGERTARLYGEANQAAIEKINTIIDKEKIDCDWERADNFVYTTDPDQKKLFRNESEAASRLGLPAYLDTKPPLPFKVAAAVRFTNQAKFHPQKYLQGLAKAINGGGCYVFEDSHVIRIRDGELGIVKTNKAKVTAKNIIVATNVPTLPLMARGGYCLLEYPIESYIVAGRLENDLSGMYISPDKNNYSILPISHGADRLLLIGGEGHISGLRGNTKARYQKLANYAQEHFGIKSIEYRWSDRDYLSYDGIPLVGKLYPWSKHVYTGSAFMKWGMTNGTVAAMILHDLIIGENNAWAEVYDSTRLKPVKSIPRVMAKYLSG